ncbi:hypothetical protein B0H17DRAFT_1143121 [Mycena rosella]|uniref:HTH CENPB-type domain-containing protein n=1 Tax=Mycena rosella TaxID=1033263 RepID=A0AAD7CW83_MYCRO|nr:hypothetical protein B0H17DRAFT_1143121 [Mycena rosella]
MTCPLGSNGQKKATKEKDRESRITNTDNLVESSQPSYAEAGQKLSCAKSTLWHRTHGRKSRHKANVHNQLLTPAEEDELAEWLKELDHWGLHSTRPDLVQIPGIFSNFRGTSSVSLKELPHQKRGTKLGPHIQQVGAVQSPQKPESHALDNNLGLDFNDFSVPCGQD